VCARTAVYRRRLVYVLMMDRMDSDTKVVQRMLDLADKLRGPRGAVEAVVALIKHMGGANRRAFFDKCVGPCALRGLTGGGGSVVPRPARLRRRRVVAQAGGRHEVPRPSRVSLRDARG
jgi:hypothetical protein